jgi:thymidine kinase
MGNSRRRLAQLEAAAVQRQREIVAEFARASGQTVDEVLADAEQFFALPLAEQLAEVDRIAAELEAQGMTMDDIEEIKATLIREYRP